MSKVTCSWRSVGGPTPGDQAERNIKWNAARNCQWDDALVPPSLAISKTYGEEEERGVAGIPEMFFRVKGKRGVLLVPSRLTSAPYVTVDLPPSQTPDRLGNLVTVVGMVGPSPEE